MTCSFQNFNVSISPHFTPQTRKVIGVELACVCQPNLDLRFIKYILYQVYYQIKVIQSQDCICLQWSTCNSSYPYMIWDHCTGKAVFEMGSSILQMCQFFNLMKMLRCGWGTPHNSSSLCNYVIFILMTM